jgi:hypothetical protein
MPTLLPRDLIAGARLLANSKPKRPSQTHLGRATSSAYYALFHTLAYDCANLLVGGTGADRSRHAWRQVYRSLEHGIARNACRSGLVGQFPKGIEDFAHAFAEMQEKRHVADYDPYARLQKSAVLAEIDLVERAIDEFGKCGKKDRRAFCAFVLFKQRS